MYSGGYSGISCVPFAREASGIELKGNAVNWWDAASGVYQRGRAPERGSVLNFRATGRMRLGHVAVVTTVVNSREVEVDHANWAGGGVERGIPIIDVSPDNDWSEVRVSLDHRGDFGSVYPTYGFIYDRPDHGTILANTTAIHGDGFDEVAEAPASAGASHFIDAPNHEPSLRPFRRPHAASRRLPHNPDAMPAATRHNSVWKRMGHPWARSTTRSLDIVSSELRP